MVAKFIKDDIRKITTPKEFGVDGGVVWNGVAISNVIFDDEDIEVQTGEGEAFIMERPTMVGSADDFTGIAANDPITCNGVTYWVRNWMRDGTGQIEIFLSKTSPV